MPLEVDVRDGEKQVYIWLDRAERGDAAFRETLQPIFKKYRAMRYPVAVFFSGETDLSALTGELLVYNRTRLVELAKEREDAAKPMCE